MCGLVGVASSFAVVNRSWLSKGRDAMIHRGPDDAGEWWSQDGRVGLAHRRLSIMDLSSAGHQPMQDVARGLSIVFNGEIYNFLDLRYELEQQGYIFYSHSDTEVLLAAYDAWGLNFLSRLNGMFAFALYDARRKTVFLARDRVGEKPLFYYKSEGVLYFGSELKALLANLSLPRKINPKALDCYLAMGYVPKELCILQGFNKLPPAHAMVFDLDTGIYKTWCYWQLPDINTKGIVDSLDELVLLDELESLFEDAVRRQSVADVPVGVLLSGGVDSSLVTAMAARVSKQVRTFTISFPNYSSLDESKHARLIANYFGTNHTELVAESTTADLLPCLARQFDEPIVDSSMIPTFLVSQLVRQHCAVVLGGDGGDELYGGYDHHSRLLWMQKKLGWIPLLLRQGIAGIAEKFFPVGLKGRNWLQALDCDLVYGLPLIASYFDARTRSSLMSCYGVWDPVALDVFTSHVPISLDLLQRVTRMDFSSYLAEDILVKVDRASMLNSLEIRAPLLDYRLVEFAFSKVPSYLKATVNNKKILLKRLTSRLLPPEFDRHRKQGFSIPLTEWLKAGSFLDFFHQVLLDENCFFDRPTIVKLLKRQKQGYDNGERLFALVLFDLWRREYGVVI